MECNIKPEDLHILLEKFEKKSYEVGSCEEGSFEYETSEKLSILINRDYKVIELDNTNGNFNVRYPCRIFIPEYERQRNVNGFNVLPNNDLNLPSTSTTNTANSCGSGRAQNVIYEVFNDSARTKEMILNAKYARCRQRFVVPVIYFKGKYICRSSTISLMPETYGRKIVDYLCETKNIQTPQMGPDDNSSTEDSPFEPDPPSPFSYEATIKHDVQLLKSLNVNTIIDLMVEFRKIKYFVAVSSSEKADPQNYGSFNILSLPYPGCEFFSKFRDNNYMAKNLFFNWNQTFIDASLTIPKGGPALDPDINWQEYRKWDLVLITQNYLKASLKYIQEGNSGILVHCISGWDRTPLFISLLRLSLWADGLIHNSMTPIEMAYFTLAYDWYQFGHQLPDRLTRGEEIMFFCFHVLKYIVDDEYSISEPRKRTKTTSSSGSSSVIVLKSDYCDDDSLKEDFFQNLDQDSNDSFANCDMSSTTNENYFSSNNLTNRSPNPKRSKTSPISVPEVSACQRQRQESTSSNGSWQVVTETGSIDSIRNGSFFMRLAQQEPQPSSSHNRENKSSSSPSADNDSRDSNYEHYNLADPSIDMSDHSHDENMSTDSNVHNKEAKNILYSRHGNRKQRLSAVRACFIQAYGKTIGLKFKEGTRYTLAKNILKSILNR